MKLSDLALGRRPFQSKSEIVQGITKSKHFDPDLESTDEAGGLLIFKTSKQQTWLVASGNRLYFILDDLRNEHPKIQRSVPKSEVFDVNDNLHANITEQSKSERSGSLKMDGLRRGYLFSKTLFTNESISDAVDNLMTRYMKG